MDSKNYQKYILDFPSTWLANLQWRIANDFCAVSQTDLLVTRHLVFSVVQITDAKLSH